MDNLDAIFSPSSVAVMGASTTPGKVGHDIFYNILRGYYRGTLYPVNPKAKAISCIRAYPSILEVPDPVDLGMIILPPRAALKAVEECVEKAVKGIVIVSAGFREVGGEGREVEDRIVDICREAGIRLVGPNCLGVINPQKDVRLNASFASRMPKHGNISFISQSGALCTAVLDFAADRGFGFSKFISIGNKADVDELDLLRYFHQDLETEVIMIYMEELRRDGQEFIDALKKITSGDRPTPVLVIKSGRTTAGAAAAASHTGALAGTEGVYQALFDEAGVMRVESVNQLFDFANAFVAKKMPSGNKIAIVTNAGGPGIVATDMTVSSGLELARFSRETEEALVSHLPATANVHNPVDVIGDAAQDRYEHALDAVIKDENVDGALVILTPQSMTNAIGTAEAIAKIAARTQKPIVCSFMGVVDVSAGVKHLQENRVPVYPFPEDAARALGALYTARKWLDRQILAQYEFQHDTARAGTIIEKALAAGRTSLFEMEGIGLLECYGFRGPASQVASSAEEAVRFAGDMGYPVVAKIVSPQILHKSDAGGVLVGLEEPEQVEAAYRQIVENASAYNPQAEIEGVLVQKMVAPGEEVILGMKRYPVFGPLLMFGLGGIYVEILKDVVFRLAPIGRNNARTMIHGIQAFPMLDGFRGRPKADVETVNRLLVCLSDMVVNHPEIKEIDVNPLRVHPKGEGATAADCRVILERPGDARNDAATKSQE